MISIKKEKRMEIIQGMREILETRTTYREGGINNLSLLTNLGKWEAKKSFVEEVLSKSEYYDKDNFSIIKPVKITRESNPLMGLMVIKDLLDNGHIKVREGIERYEMIRILRRINDFYEDSNYEKPINKDFINEVNYDYSRIKGCNPSIPKRTLADIIYQDCIYVGGYISKLNEILIFHCNYTPESKFSRVISKLFGLLFDKDTLFDMGRVYPLGTHKNCPIKNNRDGSRVLTYDKVLAQITDICSDKVVEKTLYISCHPCDYLSMSHLINGNGSCHGIRDSSKYSGCYHSATLTSMVDPSTVISFFLDKDVRDRHYLVDKTARSMIHLNKNTYIMNRPYPFVIGNEEKTVQEELEKCMLEYYNKIYNKDYKSFMDYGNHGESLGDEEDEYIEEFLDDLDIHKSSFLGYSDFYHGKPVWVKRIENTCFGQNDLTIGGTAVSIANPLVNISNTDSLYKGCIEDLEVEGDGTIGFYCNCCGYIKDNITSIPSNTSSYNSSLSIKHICRDCYNNILNTLNSLKNKEYAVYNGRYFIDVITKDLVEDSIFVVVRGLGIVSRETYEKYLRGSILINYMEESKTTFRLHYSEHLLITLESFDEEEFLNSLSNEEISNYFNPIINIRG